MKATVALRRREPAMKHNIFAFILVVAFGIVGAASAGDFNAGDITVSNPWSRATAGAARTGVIYLTIANRGDTADRLVGVAAAVAGMASLHRSAMEGGVMKMRPVAAISVGPGKAAVLKPGGLHIMLMNLERPLTEGEMFPANLTFEKAGTIRVQVMVGKAGAIDGGAMRHD
jgi:copper(I)-binding protein